MAQIRALFRNPTHAYMEDSTDADELRIGAVRAQGISSGPDLVSFFGNGGIIRNIGTPVQSTDAATKAYVDALKSGFSLKDPVRVATTAALAGTYSSTNGGTLTGMPNSVDGVSLSIGDRVLVKNTAGSPASGANNGLYVVTTVGTGTDGVWVRSDDANETGEVMSGLSVHVMEGTNNKDTTWVITSPDTEIILGTTSFTFTQWSGISDLVAGDGLRKNGNRIDVGAGAGISVTSGAQASVSVDFGNGLWLDTGNANKLSVRAAASGGLSVGGTGVSVAPGNGISVGANVSARIDTTAGGLRFNSGQIAVNPGAAISVGSTVGVKVAAAGGVEVSSDSLAIKLDNASGSGEFNGSGLALSASGLRVAIEGSNSTLRLVGTNPNKGLGVKYDTARGLGADSNGLHLKADTTHSFSYSTGTLTNKANEGRAILISNGIGINIEEGASNTRTLAFEGAGTAKKLAVRLGLGMKADATGIQPDIIKVINSGGMMVVNGIEPHNGQWSLGPHHISVTGPQLTELTNGSVTELHEHASSGYVSSGSLVSHPQVARFVAGEALALGDVVCMSPSDGEVYKARSDDIALANVIGICTAATASGGVAPVAMSGGIASTFITASLTPGQTAYLGLTGGMVTSWPTTKGTRIVRLGYQGVGGFVLQIADFGLA